MTDAHTDAHTAPGLQRLVALVLLLAAGIISLPLAAAAFDGEGTENWILPAQLGGMAALGAWSATCSRGWPVTPPADAVRPGSAWVWRCCWPWSGSCSSSCC